MGVGEWFSTFCSNLQVKDSSSISTRYKSLTARLNSDFRGITSDVLYSLYVGSYGRNTAIQGFSDLDMMYELPSSEYWKYNSYVGNGQSALLQAVKKSIAQTYPTTSLRADGQVIVVPFTVGLSFEVLPVIVSKTGSYIFPDTNGGGSWKETNPKPEIQEICSRNKLCNGNLVPLCRMARAWKRKWTVPIGGLLIDTLAYQFIDTWAHKDKSYLYYDYMCRDFFKWLSDQSSEREYWYAPGSGQRVYGKGLFQYKAKQCYNIALEAIAHETATPKQEWSAKQKWRSILGTEFPD